MAANVDTGCDMTEEEILAMLKGISVKRQEARDVDAVTASATDNAGTRAAAVDAADDGDAPAAGGDETRLVAKFLARNPEKHAINQYWYSPATIACLVGEVVDACDALDAAEAKPAAAPAAGAAAPAAALGAALVSTPSVYFSLPAKARARCKVLDLDEQWAADPGFVRYDFNEPEAVPDDCKGAFSLVVIDPPFITREVWAQYARTARLLLAPGGRLLCTTIAENAPMMAELLDVRPTAFLPSIPHLVYQYNVYANYESERLACPNDEIPGCE